MFFRSGSVRLGTNLQMVTLDQRRESLDPDCTLSDALTGGGNTVDVGGETRHVIGYMKDFLFKPEQARTPVGVLSGGERGRLMLARALARPSNLLVLDEPTNDLDLETLDLLQEMLADYDGTALVVSHDRDFLDRVVTAVIASEGNGKWIVYAGGYSDMVAQRRGQDSGDPTETRSAGPRQALPKTRKSNVKTSKLSFTDRHLLETLPARIEKIRIQIEAHNATLAENGLFERDRKAFESAAQKLRETAAALEAAEEQWLELELKREELEGG